MIRREFDIEQIDLISKLLFNILFPKDFEISKLDEFVFDGNLVDLKLKLKKLISLKKFAEAQSLLLSEIEKYGSENNEVLRLAVWFYVQVNEFDDGVLQKNGFSKHEVLEGLEAVEKMVMEI